MNSSKTVLACASLTLLFSISSFATIDNSSKDKAGINSDSTINSSEATIDHLDSDLSSNLGTNSTDSSSVLKRQKTTKRKTTNNQAHKECATDDSECIRLQNQNSAGMYEQ